MSDVNRPPVRKVWLVSLFIGIGFFLLLLIGRGGLEAESQESFLHILCDALFVPGVLLGGTGLLVVVAGEGAFDAIRYGLQKLFSLMRREEKRAALPKTYFDYVQAKRGRRVSPWGLLLVGLGFLLAASVVLILYYRTI